MKKSFIPTHKMSFYKRSKFRYMKKGISKPSLYTNHLCLSSKALYEDLDEFYQFAVFDPGFVSCGLRIVRYNLVERTMNVIFFSILNFGSQIADIMVNLKTEIENISKYLQECHHIIIERQIMKNAKGYQTYSTLIYEMINSVCNRGLRPMILLIDCKLKTTFLGGPSNKKCNNSDEMKQWIFEKTGQMPANGSVEIKEWSKMKARIFSIERGDFISYHILENSKYKGNEDLSDTVCYEYAWIMYAAENDFIFLPFDRNFLS